MKEVYVILNSSGIVIAAMNADGYAELSIEKALNAYHDALDGEEIENLRHSYTNIDNTHFYNYNVGDKTEEISLNLCAFYKV